ncbi:MAG: PAS domain S-box protein [Thermoplasmata archaeon]
MSREKKKSEKTAAGGYGLSLDARYKTLFETSQDAIMLLDRDRFFDCNPATLRMFGLTREIFIKLHPSEISPPRQADGRNSREEADKRISEAFERGTNRFEWIHRRSNGEDFPVTVWLTAFSLEGKSVLQATVREVSPMAESQTDLEAHRLKLQMLLDEKAGDFKKETEERRRAEREVRRLIKAVETSFNAVALFDMEMNIIYANQSFCKMAGIDSNEIESKSVRNLIPEESLKLFQENIQKSLEREENERFEMTSKNALGEERWVEVALSMLFGDDGEPEGLLAIINDVTERRNILDALKESEEKFKMMVERSLDGILIIQDGKVAYMNQALVKLSGYSLDEQIGREFIDNVAPEKREEVMARYMARLKGEDVPQIYETIFFTKGGSRIPVEINAGVMEYRGRPADFVYLRDLTERRKAEEDIKTIKEQFEYVLGATNTGFDIIDGDFNVVYVDPEWAKSLGNYSGRKCYEYFMGGKKMCDGCAIPQALKKEEKVISEEFLKKENRHIEVHTIPFREKSGKWLVLEFNIDITERKRMMHSLRESEEKFRNLAEYSPNMIFINKMGHVVYANRMCEELMGFTREEFLDKDFDLMTIIHKDYQKLIRGNLQKHFKGEDVPPYEYKLVAKSGNALDVIISTKTIEYGGETAILGIVTDISGLKKAQEAQMANETRYRELANGISSGVAVYEAEEDGKDFVIRDFNQAAERIEKLQKADAIGRRVTEVFPGIREMGLLKVFKRVWKTGVPEHHPISMYRDNRIAAWRENFVYKLPTGEIVAIYNDVTERKKAEQALMESEEKYRMLTEKANDAIFLADAKTGILIDVNQKACELTGRSRKELIGMHQAKLHPSEEVKIYEKIFKAHVKNGSAIHENIVVAHKGGRRVPVSISASVFEIGGRMVNQGIFHDLTERVMAEGAIKKSEEKIQTIFTSMEDLVFGFDANEIFISCHSPASGKLFLPKEMFIGKLYSDVMPPHVVKLLAKGFGKNRKHESADFEYPLSLGEEERWFSAKMSPIFIDEEYNGSVAVVRDITERRRMEEELRSSREQLNALFQASTSGIGVECEEKLFFVNPAFVNMFGYGDEKEVTGISLASLMAPKDRKRVKSYSKLRLRGKAPSSYEFTGQRKDGSTFDAEVSVSVYSIGTRSYYVGFVQDITERKRAELFLRLSEGRFRRMAENIHDGLTIIENGKVDYVNERAVEIYGYPREELMKMSQIDLIVPEDRKQMLTIMENARKRDQKIGELEFWILAKDGSRRYVRTRISSSQEEGSTNEFIITTDITARKLAEDENKRRMMKFLLEDGRMYLVKEFRPQTSIEAFNDLLGLEYLGMVLSRTPKKDIAKSIKGPFEFLWIGEKSEKSLFNDILSTIGNMGGKSAVFIDRLDYLVFKYGFKETLDFIFKLRDLIYLKEQVVIISMDPSTMKEEELAIMQKEMSEVEQREVPRPAEDVFEIAQFIFDKNSSGIKPSYSEIGDELKISKPTCRKRVRRLINTGYATELTKGNRKVLELTQKGRNLFFK